MLRPCSLPTSSAPASSSSAGGGTPWPTRSSIRGCGSGSPATARGWSATSAPTTTGSGRGRRLYVAERGGETVGLLIASPSPLRKGWLIEEIVRGRAAPNGTTELLLDTAICALAETGAEYVTLGLSPLSRAVPQRPAPPWTVRPLLAWMRVHTRRFYNFEGLETFKRKFLPEEWEPIYAVTDRPRVSLRTLYAIA